MLSKSGRGYDQDAAPADKRFRRNVSDLFLANALSGERTASLINDAHAAGSVGVEDLTTDQVDNHSGRNLLRKLLKKSQRPKLYSATIRVKDPKTDEALLASNFHKLIAQ